MIIIISNLTDLSTNKVMSFLKILNDSTIRIDVSRKIDTVSLNFEDSNIIIGNDNIFSHKIWYRTGDLAINYPSENISNSIRSFLISEWVTLKSYIYSHNNFFTLGNFDGENKKNKILDIKNAQKAGLVTPKFLTTNSKIELLKFQKRCKNIVTKPLDNLNVMYVNHYILSFSRGVTLLSYEAIKAISDFFFPSLFQEYIEKIYEIRVFYLKGKIYSMAIFSQLDEQTKTDYRNYNRAKPNRNVPYQLPLEIEEKIRLFMDKSGLDTGSLDIIRATDGRFVFLEVNPCGQFDWLSVNCNYYLEQKIANYLAYGTID